MKKTLGIIGGMGPAATCDLMEKVIALTKAATDQEHLHMIVDVNSAIPNRTEAILCGGENPVPEIQRSARRLEAAGAELLLMPCNTSYYFYDRIQAAVSIPLLHMPREAAEVLKAAGVNRAGILATDGTIRGGVYEKALSEVGIQAVFPGQEDQRQVMRLIYEGVKARAIPYEAIPVEEILWNLREQGAEKTVLACTELPIAFQALGMMEGCLDATRALAFAAVLAAGAETTDESPW